MFGIQMVTVSLEDGLFEYWTFWTIKQTLIVQFSDYHSNTGPLDNHTILNTDLFNIQIVTV